MLCGKSVFSGAGTKGEITCWLVIGRYFCWGNTIFLIKLESIAFRGSMQRATTLFGLARCAKDGDWLLLLLWTWTIMRNHWRMNCKGEKKRKNGKGSWVWNCWTKYYCSLSVSCPLPHFKGKKKKTFIRWWWLFLRISRILFLWCPGLRCTLAKMFFFFHFVQGVCLTMLFVNRLINVRIASALLCYWPSRVKIVWNCLSSMYYYCLLFLCLWFPFHILFSRNAG